MSRRTTTRVAWSLCSVTLLLMLAASALSLRHADLKLLADTVGTVGVLTLPVVGLLVASRQPENSIGWLFSATGLLLGLSGATTEYAAYALADGMSRPGGVLAAWVASWVFLPALFGVPALLFLLFPDGRPLSPRWRWVVAAALLALVCQTAVAALAPGPMGGTADGVPNPYPLRAPRALAAVQLVGWTLSLVTIGLAALCLLLRARRSDGLERLQMRWFLSSAAFFAAACLVSAALFPTRLAPVGQGLVFFSFTLIPVAAGVAILRHRLYDIDMVINRTLVYGALTVTLAATYLGSVLLLQLLLAPLTDESDLAVAASTLAVAALFGPARRRIQRVVDRRFFRTRYDVGRTLETFGGRLRQDVDLELLGADLRRIVTETMQPAHVSLWLRSAP